MIYEMLTKDSVFHENRYFLEPISSTQEVKFYACIFPYVWNYCKKISILIVIQTWVFKNSYYIQMIFLKTVNPFSEYKINIHA